jgi:ketosteroid isomerase-like protein
MRIASILFILSSLFAFGCGPKLIPGLGIELRDTPDNRAILKVLDAFAQAYETKDIDGLVSLASKNFFETSGSTETDDDYGYDGLRRHFTEHFKMVEKIKLEMQLKNVEVSEDQAMVDYRYVTRYLMKLPSGDKWKLTDDVNRMKLAREEGQWKILSGM